MRGKLVFRKMVTLCKRLDLIERKVIATDGTKLRAQNSKKNNFNQKKIDDQLAYIENKLHEYLDALDVADTAETMGLDPDIDEVIAGLISSCFDRIQTIKLQIIHFQRRSNYFSFKSLSYQYSGIIL
jgi:hypothetical protein